jgi:hypothetical protein
LFLFNSAWKNLKLLVVRAHEERETGKRKPLASISYLACAVLWDASKKVATMTPRKNRNLTAMTDVSELIV